MAGIIDADGCFNIGRDSNDVFVPRLLVTNTNEDIARWLVEKFGGHVSKTKVKDRPKWKARYQWRISNQKALDLSNLIIDYLIIKWEQALVFRAWALCRNVFKQPERRKPYQFLAEKLKGLNMRGIKC